MRLTLASTFLLLSGCLTATSTLPPQHEAVRLCDVGFEVRHFQLRMEAGEFNASVLGRSTTTWATVRIPSIQPGGPLHVEVRATWTTDMGAPRGELFLEDDQGTRIGYATASPPEFVVTSSAGPEAFVLRFGIPADGSKDADVAVLVKPRIVQVEMSQQTSCSPAETAK